LLVEILGFALAASVHRGVLLHGYEHPVAWIAEGLIALVLLIGLGLTWVWPAGTRPIGLTAQVLALLGTLVGVFTIVVGIGPRTVPDLAFHISILIVLAWGLVVAARSPVDGAR
jgi:FtsH-binding integral membrane protein